MSDSLLTHIDDKGIATITLNRPKVHNAFDDELIHRLHLTLEQLDIDTSVRVVKLAANGKSFSAGADLNWMQKMANYSQKENLADAMELTHLFQVLSYISKPTIALVHGAAIGGGVGLVAACDIAVASTKAVFQLSEVRLGLVPAVVSPYVISAIGPRAAQRYFLTGERFSAKDALHLGLVHEVTDEDKLEDAATLFCDNFLQNGPCAMAEVKKLTNQVRNAKFSNKLLTETAKFIARVRVSQEGQEGIKAFLSKKRPNWIK